MIVRRRTTSKDRVISLKGCQGMICLLVFARSEKSDKLAGRKRKTPFSHPATEPARTFSQNRKDLLLAEDAVKKIRSAPHLDNIRDLTDPGTALAQLCKIHPPGRWKSDARQKIVPVEHQICPYLLTWEKVRTDLLFDSESLLIAIKRQKMSSLLEFLYNIMTSLYEVF